jgi:hypothetical protein
LLAEGRAAHEDGPSRRGTGLEDDLLCVLHGFLAYPLTDTRFRQTVSEFDARHGIKIDRGDTAVESVEAAASHRETR